MGQWTLYVLNMVDRTVSIMDPMPIPKEFKLKPRSLYYVKTIKAIANNINLGMDLVNPKWVDHIFWWRRILPPWVPRTADW